MTSVEFESIRPANPVRTSGFGLSAAFAATLFLSAFLLFSVQPLFTKMVLPVLGGSPGVWSVAMVFFQALLLGGYLWAHVITRAFSLRIAVALHLTLTAAAFLALPIALPSQSLAPPETGQSLWLIGLFAGCVGLPFFALSANGPLLQAWFARTGHPSAENPYTLYGASNIGSFGALLAYPFLLEPFIGLSQQSASWSAGFGALIFCLLMCGGLALRRTEDTFHTPATLSIAGNWTWRSFAQWTLLAAIPSGLLVAVTAHVSTDIAAAPLLWVLPLALYLLTFVIAFRGGFPLRGSLILPVQVFATILMLTFMTFSGLPLLVVLAAHLAFFFVSVLLCHRSLYELRPANADLTAFYVAMSLGGVVGGLFAGLLAPQVFSSVVEYPLLVAAILLCQPAFVQRLKNTRTREIALAALASALVIAACWKMAGSAIPASRAVALCGAALFTLAILRWRSAAHVGLCSAALCIAATWLPQSVSNATSWRSFFGVHKVREVEHEGLRFRTLMHGTTMHGAVRIDTNRNPAPAHRPLPTTYYAYEGPIGEAIASLRERHGKLQTTYAIGLGIGTLSCHRRSDEDIVFFEIDPEVIRIARTSSLFNFLSACAPDARIVTGDARLTLAAEKALANPIIIDAFSSDSIPVHLLTREAFAIYLSRLAPDGALIFHVSNNMMDLSPVIARIAADFGLVAFRRIDVVTGGADANMRTSSIAMALARDSDHLGPIASNAQWKLIVPDMRRKPWTDDYSTIMEPILDARR
jgi:hypothetical protein